MRFDDPLTTTLMLLVLPALLANLAALFWRSPGLAPRDPAVLPGASAGVVSLAQTTLRIGRPLRALATALPAALAIVLIPMQSAPVPHPGLPFGWLLLAILTCNALALWLWELRFDRVGLSCSVLLFWRRSHLWRALEQVSEDGPLSLRLHFADGSSLRIPRHVSGREDLMRMAAHWLSGAHPAQEG